MRERNLIQGFKSMKDDIYFIENEIDSYYFSKHKMIKTLLCNSHHSFNFCTVRYYIMPSSCLYFREQQVLSHKRKVLDAK